MKKPLFLLVLILAVASSISAKINLPPAKDIRLDNGLTVKVIERANLPLFSVRMVFKAGSKYDPAGQEGLANLCNEMLMRGTGTRDARQIAEEIAFGGGTLNNFADRESAGFSGEFLSQNGEAGIAVLADMVLNSAFSDIELQKTRTRIMAELESQLEDPFAVASINFYHFLLNDNQFAHQTKGTIATVGQLERQDIVDFFESHCTPDNCLLIFCGDIDSVTVVDWIDNYFAGWSGKSKVADGESAFSPVAGKEILILDKQDATQTQIRIGGLGLPMNHPDYIPFTLARSIYAGSFTSRLMNEIRVKRGLTYGVRMSFNSFKPGGVVYVSTYTKNQSVGEVLDIILSEAERMRVEPVPDSELVGSINYRCGLYPLNFETNDDIAEIYANIWFYGLDKSRYEDFQERIRQVSADDVMRMAREYFPGGNFRLVLVGKADEIKDQVSPFGNVSVKSIGSIP